MLMLMSFAVLLALPGSCHGNSIFFPFSLINSLILLLLTKIKFDINPNQETKTDAKTPHWIKII